MKPKKAAKKSKALPKKPWKPSVSPDGVSIGTPVRVHGELGEHKVSAWYLSPHTDEPMYCVELTTPIETLKKKAKTYSIMVRGVCGFKDMTILKGRG